MAFEANTKIGSGVLLHPQIDYLHTDQFNEIEWTAVNNWQLMLKCISRQASNAFDFFVLNIKRRAEQQTDC